MTKIYHAVDGALLQYQYTNNNGYWVFKCPKCSQILDMEKDQLT